MRGAARHADAGHGIVPGGCRRLLDAEGVAVEDQAIGEAVGTGDAHLAIGSERRFEGAGGEAVALGPEHGEDEMGSAGRDGLGEEVALLLPRASFAEAGETASDG